MIGHAILSLLLAAIAIAVLSIGVEHPRRAPVFIVMFLAIWAGGATMAPRGVGFLRFYSTFVLVAVLLSTVGAVYARHGRTPPPEEMREIETGLGLFFWLLVVGLVAVILWAYV
jgi:hypothetical protein